MIYSYFIRMEGKVLGVTKHKGTKLKNFSKFKIKELLSMDV